MIPTLVTRDVHTKTAEPKHELHVASQLIVRRRVSVVRSSGSGLGGRKERVSYEAGKLK